MAQQTPYLPWHPYGVDGAYEEPLPSLAEDGMIGLPQAVVASWHDAVITPARRLHARSVTLGPDSCEFSMARPPAAPSDDGALDCPGGDTAVWMAAILRQWRA